MSSATDSEAARQGALQRFHQIEDPGFSRATDELIEYARSLTPTIRARAKETEQLRKLTPEAMVDLEPFWSALVPRVFGGRGLGTRAMAEVARTLAHGDASTAWSTAFIMEHSWMAAHLDLEAQKELFAERPFILAAAPGNPSGRTEKVEGGFRVSGTFRYGSGMGNSDWVFVTSPAWGDGLEGQPHTFLLSLTQPGVTVNDDWHMSGMAASSSASVTADHVFVPTRMSIPTEQFISSDRHPGAVHEESFLRYPPLATIGDMMSGIALGCAEAVVELAREKLGTTIALGQPRLERPLARVRWGQAFEKVRCAQLLWRDTMYGGIVKNEALTPWSEEEVGQIELDHVTIVHLAHEAVGHILDGMGSSPYQVDNPFQRYRRDMDVIANHLFHDRDIVLERATRNILGATTGGEHDPFVQQRPLTGADDAALRADDAPVPAY